MEFYRHKASGKIFIFIGYIDDDIGYFVTPEGKRKELELSMFEEVDEIDSENFLSGGLLSSKQVESCNQYIKNREDDLVERSVRKFDEMPLHKQQEFLKKLSIRVEQDKKKTKK